MKLSQDLEYWRAERPDEWKMDEFIRKAILLEEKICADATNYQPILYALRNPYGIPEEEMRKVRLEAANKIEQVYILRPNKKEPK